MSRRAERSQAIRRGDFVLIDIWGEGGTGRMPCCYDITWTGVVDREPTEREQMVFEAVRDARDAAIAVVREAFAAGRPIAGWEADDAAREVIRRGGDGRVLYASDGAQYRRQSCMAMGRTWTTWRRMMSG